MILKNKFDFLLKKRTYILPLIFFLGAYTAISTFKLVKNFEKNVEKKEFKPKANFIEIIENKNKTQKAWKIIAEGATSNEALEEIKGKNVKAEIYDDEQNVKMKVRSERASINRKTSNCRLVGNVEIELIKEKLTITSNRLNLIKDSPIEILDNVQFFLTNDHSKRIIAERAEVYQKEKIMTLFNILPSPIGDGVFLSGGQMDLALQNNEIKVITITNGVFVQGPDFSCRSSMLNLYIKDKKPSLAVFLGNPIAHQKNKKLKADIIKYDLQNKILKAEGHIKVF